MTVGDGTLSTATDAELVGMVTGRADGGALVREWHGVGKLAGALVPELTGAGLSDGQATRLAAAVELGRRVVSVVSEPARQFRSSADVWHVMGPLRAGLTREMFDVLLVNSAHRLIRRFTVTVGTLNLALVHPRDVFRPAIAEGAAGVVLVHNHPGGDPAPSDEDAALTRQLVRAGEAVGIPVLDHVVLGEGRWFSFADSHRMTA